MNKTPYLLILIFALASFSCNTGNSNSSTGSEEFDVIIKNGTVYDGTGEAPGTLMGSCCTDSALACILASVRLCHCANT